MSSNMADRPTPREAVTLETIYMLRRLYNRFEQSEPHDWHLRAELARYQRNYFGVLLDLAERQLKHEEELRDIHGMIEGGM